MNRYCLLMKVKIWFPSCVWWNRSCVWRPSACLPPESSYTGIQTALRTDFTLGVNQLPYYEASSSMVRWAVFKLKSEFQLLHRQNDPVTPDPSPTSSYHPRSYQYSGQYDQLRMNDLWRMSIVEDVMKIQIKSVGADNGCLGRHLSAKVNSLSVQAFMANKSHCDSENSNYLTIAQ